MNIKGVIVTATSFTDVCGDIWDIKAVRNPEDYERFLTVSISQAVPGDQIEVRIPVENLGHLITSLEFLRAATHTVEQPSPQ
jgi:hypothetical protein